MNGLEDFIDFYYSMVSAAAARLAGSSDPEGLAVITEKVIADLWQYREELAGEPRPGTYIYKRLLPHVFTWLKEKGQQERIAFLKKTLLIDPAYYAPALEM